MELGGTHFHIGGGFYRMATHPATHTTGPVQFKRMCWTFAVVRLRGVLRRTEDNPEAVGTPTLIPIHMQAQFVYMCTVQISIKRGRELHCHVYKYRYVYVPVKKMTPLV